MFSLFANIIYLHRKELTESEISIKMDVAITDIECTGNAS